MGSESRFMKTYFAEAIGTFALVFAGTGAIVINDVSGATVTHVGTALTFGLVVMAMIGGLQSQSQPAGGCFSKKTSVGVRKPRQARGRWLSSFSTRRTSAWEMSWKSVPWGKY